MTRILIVGIGALGGTIATRAINAGIPVWLATRTADSANALRASGLRLTGIGGAATASAPQIATIDDYRERDKFDLILSATKAHAALKIAPQLAELLMRGGTLLPIQNGSVSQMVADEIPSCWEGYLTSAPPWLNLVSTNSGMLGIC